MKTDVPVDKRRSLSMMVALGLMMANGARADARARRERVRRGSDRIVTTTGNSDGNSSGDSNR
jgi:hypothetical protein